MAELAIYNGKSAILKQGSFAPTLELNLKQPWFAEEDHGGSMKKYVIEREVPKIGILERQKLQEAAGTSNEALRQLAPHIQWVESFVAEDKTFCVYLAEDESLIHRHSELSGIPVKNITEIGKMIDPTTGSPCQ